MKLSEHKGFTVSDNDERHITPYNEVKITRRVNAAGHSLVWTMSFDDLVDLQSTIATYIAGDRLG